MHNITFRNTFTRCLIILMFSFLFFSCKKDNAVVETKPVKDPRTYSWTADTLVFPDNSRTEITDIWGSSPSDVYVTGYNGGNRYQMWHFDGKHWSNVNLITSEGGQIDANIEINSIFGFSSTDVYAAGERIVGYNTNPPPTFLDSSLIIHYDGSTWRQLSIPNGNSLNEIYGTSSNNIWAGGQGKKLYHFDGVKWNLDSINITVPEGFTFQVSSISSNNSNIYIEGVNNNNSTGENIFYLFKRVNNSWVAQDSSFAGRGEYSFGFSFNKSNLSDFYTIGYGIYIYNKTYWVKVQNSSLPFISIWGSNNNNIFAVGMNGLAYNYNGTDWTQIEELNNPKFTYSAVWTEGTEVFVAGSYDKTIIWHGK